MMKIERLNFDTRERPFSQAVRAGDFVYTAGASIGDPGDNISVQTAKTIDYLADILQKAGTDLKHVVKATVFLADLDEWGQFNEVWKSYFPTDKPVRTTTEVGKFGGHTRIEIDFVAVMPESHRGDILL
jgi:2-iminobutanoate/2-iminopropanoate deaminase